MVRDLLTQKTVIHYPCLRFSTSYYPASLLIRWRTDFSFSHVEFETSTGWTFGSRLIGGVRWRPPKESSQVNVRRATFAGIAEALVWASANRVGFGYDVAGIFGLALGIQDWRDKKTRFCSELVAEAAEVAGCPIFNKDLPCWQVTPRDVAISAAVHFFKE
jgi:hypothetical protein